MMVRTPLFRWWHIVLATLLSFFVGWHFHEYQQQSPNEFSLEDFIQSRLVEAETIWSKGVETRHATEKVSKISDKKPWKPVHNRLIWDFFYPNYNCPHLLERIGRVGDGGKWVCGLSHITKNLKSCIVYSYGISGDTSFEEEILSRTNCTLYAYDHTVQEDKIKLTKLFPMRFIFNKLGLGINNEGQMSTLKSEMDKNEHIFIDILKIDIEGAEFSVFRQILLDFQNGLPFGQLLIELHLNKLPQIGLFKHMKVWWENLENSGLRAFHNEPNLFAIIGWDKNPSYFEVSFLNVKVDNIFLHS